MAHGTPVSQMTTQNGLVQTSCGLAVQARPSPIPLAQVLARMMLPGHQSHMMLPGRQSHMMLPGRQSQGANGIVVIYEATGNVLVLGRYRMSTSNLMAVQSLETAGTAMDTPRTLKMMKLRRRTRGRWTKKVR